jgi:hypothetical protein
MVSMNEEGGGDMCVNSPVNDSIYKVEDQEKTMELSLDTYEYFMCTISSKHMKIELLYTYTCTVYIAC